MFKKQITYFVVYFLRGNSNQKYSIYVSLNVYTADAKSFNDSFLKLCQTNHEEKYGINECNICIESINMISFQISLFGLKII
jgi:hypothetical protein